jgi:hypothetical protein
MEIHTNVEALSYARQVPYGLNSDLGDSDFTGLVHTDLAIWYETAFSYTLFELWHFHVSSCNGNSRPNFDIVFVHGFLE